MKLSTRTLKPRLIEREGPTGAIITTTEVNLHPENETRLISVTVDDSADQTAAVMRSAAGRYERADEDESVFKPWHELQAWLELGDRAVLVPYAAELAARIPPVATRLRRDFPVPPDADRGTRASSTRRTESETLRGASLPVSKTTASSGSWSSICLPRPQGRQ